MQRDATREDRVLDLFCTNKPSLVKAMTTVPGISDHDAIVTDCDVKPAYVKKKPRSIFLFSKANWSEMKSDALKFASEFMGKCADLSVEQNWSSLKDHIATSMVNHIPSKITSKRQNLPWLTGDLRRRSKRKHRITITNARQQRIQMRWLNSRNLRRKQSVSRRGRGGNSSIISSTRH